MEKSDYEIFRGTLNTPTINKNICLAMYFLICSSISSGKLRLKKISIKNFRRFQDFKNIFARTLKKTSLRAADNTPGL